MTGYNQTDEAYEICWRRYDMNLSDCRHTGMTLWDAERPWVLKVPGTSQVLSSTLLNHILNKPRNFSMYPDTPEIHTKLISSCKP